MRSVSATPHAWLRTYWMLRDRERLCWLERKLHDAVVVIKTTSKDQKAMGGTQMSIRI